MKAKQSTVNDSRHAIIWTIVSYCFLSGMSITAAFALSGAGSAKRDFASSVAWMSRAGGFLLEDFGWLMGFYGAVIIALFLDRALAFGQSRPSNRNESRYLAMVSAVALVSSVSTTFIAFLVLMRVIDDPTLWPHLIPIIPATSVLVVLCVAVASRARPTLASELRTVKSSRKLVRARIRKWSNRRALRWSALWTTFGVTMVATSVTVVVGDSSLAVEYISLTSVLVALETATVTLVAATIKATVLQLNRAAAICAGAVFEFLFGWIIFFTAINDLPGIVPYLFTAFAIGVPVVSAVIVAPANQSVGSIPPLHWRSFTIGSASAHFAQAQLATQHKALSGRLSELKTERRHLRRSKG